MRSIILEARREGANEYGVRNRFGDINAERLPDEKKMAMALKILVGWQRTEPTTEFRIVWREL